MITNLDDSTQDTPLEEVARLIYNSNAPEYERSLYLEGCADWTECASAITGLRLRSGSWAHIERQLDLELDGFYENELEWNQGRDEDRRIGYADRYGN
tara:strand:- start:1316 stop:1609 length:294 start_codon:yes stop_codon:yes gene_type:complete